MAVAVAALGLAGLISVPSPASAQQSPPQQLPFDDLFGPKAAPHRSPDALPDDRHGAPAPKSPGARSGKDAKEAAPHGRTDDKSAEAKEPKPIPRSLRRPDGGTVPEGGAQRAALLSDLYAYLATATDEEVAKRIANAIEHVWAGANSDTVNLLMDRATRAEAGKNSSLALQLFERAVELQPDNPEVFSRRALVYYTEGDLERALGDLRRALALDPNHYRSLESLAQILKDLDKKTAALAVLRRLREVHPYFSGVKSAIDELAREVEGKDL